MQTREEKINLVRSLLLGKGSLYPVIFCEYREFEAGVYLDKDGGKLTQIEMMEQVSETRTKAAIVWHEVRTYNTVNENSK